MSLRSLTAADWLMIGAVILFIASGIAKFAEKQGRLGAALILLGIANALLLTLARR